MAEQPQQMDDRARQRPPASPEEEITALQDVSLEPPQDYFAAGIAATGMAAATVAVVTSYLGAGGTFWGAVLGAIIGSTASQVAKPRLARLEHRVRLTLRRARQLSLPEALAWVADVPGKSADAVRQFPVRTAVTTLALGASGLVLAMTWVTLVEMVEGRPLSAIVTNEPEPGTTVSRLIEERPSLPQVPAGRSDGPSSAAPPTRPPGENDNVQPTSAPAQAATSPVASPRPGAPSPEPSTSTPSPDARTISPSPEPRTPTPSPSATSTRTASPSATSTTTPAAPPTRSSSPSAVD